MSQNQCRVAVIGAGSMAREHLRAFADVPGVLLTGIHSRTRARAEALAAEFGISAVCDDIASLYAASKADLVVVTVTELSMAAVAKACFAFPWTILLEKPAGYDLADAVGIAEAAGAARARVHVALNRRHLSSTRTALDDLNAVPGPRFIHVQDQESMAQAAAIGHPETVVRNWMYANAVHMVDYLAVFGRGTVTSVTPVQPWDPERPGIVLAKVEFSSGDLALYEAVWNGPAPWACTVTTPARRWEMRPLEKAVFQNAGERMLNPAPLHPWDEAFKPGFRRQAELAVQVAGGGPSDGLPTLEDSLATMRLIAAIYGDEKHGGGNGSGKAAG
ncbi:Gfo/Idh/MocA family oxidoreductase [Azospirillum sp. B21]|uniref:Gfo/Idh/MocA family protein n=1 Tax=Azospirillum sp. B21 TaxID=2607496 RepID=UPI0020002837|nr:Gfo/Idh/MocA family oxidoreductase [Azospirillum sp. B21]